MISESIRLRDIKAVKKGKRRAEQVTCHSTSTHMHTHARARTRALLLVWGWASPPPRRRLWLLREIVLFATIWKPYLVLFKGTFLFHMRAVLPRHHRFDICHRHCNSEEKMKVTTPWESGDDRKEAGLSPESTNTVVIPETTATQGKKRGKKRKRSKRQNPRPRN